MKYFGQNTLAHHEMTSNLNKVNDIVDPQIKLRPTPEKKPTVLQSMEDIVFPQLLGR